MKLLKVVPGIESKTGTLSALMARDTDLDWAAMDRGSH
jgi:hypothetical protein